MTSYEEKSPRAIHISLVGARDEDFLLVLANV